MSTFVREPVTAEQRADGHDEWATPWHVYNVICDHWKLEPTIDLFADSSNTKCYAYYTAEQDALKQDWAGSGHKVGWLQPPYSQPILSLAIEKAIFEARRGFTSVYLLPDWTDRTWCLDLMERYPEFKFWRDLDKPNAKQHRIKFLPPPGIKPSSPRYGNIHGVIRSEINWRELL
jgi:phage N-6-adenine-methyltransferase